MRLSVGCEHPDDLWRPPTSPHAVTPPSRPLHTERSTLAACIAHVAGASAGDVPLDPDEQRGWLAERGLGLVPVADAATFSWAGPWIALRPARDGSGARAVVMFGVPSGAIWDPADTAEEILEGSIVAPLDVAAWPPRAAAAAGVGVVEALVIAPAAEAPVVLVGEAFAIVGQGLRGDRYAAASRDLRLRPAGQRADARRRRRPRHVRARPRPPPQRRGARHRSQRPRRARVRARRGALSRPPPVRTVRPPRPPQRRRRPAAARAPRRTARRRHPRRHRAGR